MKTAGTMEKLQMCLNIVNATWKQFSKFSKFAEGAHKRERRNLDDVEGLEISYSLKRSR